jgi:putative tryptophan/tyrosine transport system substrate-binding protein
VQRRELIAAALGVACAPFAVKAQPAGKLYRIGWLDYSSSAENLGIFDQAMAARGWIKGRTFAIEYRGGEGNIERLNVAAMELARMAVDVIVAPGTSASLAAKKATSSIPVVMVGVDDPVERGLVASLGRPGGNITGLTNAGKELAGKLLSLVRELLPRATSVAMLWDSTNPDHRVVLGQLEAAARTLKVTLNPVEVRRYTEVEPAIAAIRKQGSQVLIVPASSMLVPAWIADLALKNGLALASTSAGFVYEGGLMAYVDDWNAVFDRASYFVDRILKGAKPADLPVEQPTKFKLIVNAKTAQALGIAIPSSILVRADHIIE